MHAIDKIDKHELVARLSFHKFTEYRICNACVRGKQVTTCFKSIRCISITKPLEMLHMDLYGLIRIQSIDRSKYKYVIIDDCSRYTRTLFLKDSTETYKEFMD